MHVDVWRTTPLLSHTAQMCCDRFMIKKKLEWWWCSRVTRYEWCAARIPISTLTFKKYRLMQWKPRVQGDAPKIIIIARSKQTEKWFCCSTLPLVVFAPHTRTHNDVECLCNIAALCCSELDFQNRFYSNLFTPVSLSFWSPCIFIWFFFSFVIYWSEIEILLTCFFFMCPAVEVFCRTVRLSSYPS